MRKTTKILTLAVAAATLLPATGLMAQRRRGLVDVSPPSDRHGAWLTFGLGAGAENYRYSNVPGGYGNHDNNTQPSFFIAAGGTVNPNLRLGGEINSWIYSHEDVSGFHATDYLVSGMMTGQLFPMRQMGLYVKGGLGISRSGASVEGGSDTGETGFAYLLGAGYEIKLSRGFYLTPQVNWVQHRSSISAADDVDNLGALHERVVSFGVALTIQPGR